MKALGDATCQIIVCGGGLIGSKLAHELGSYGVDCVLVEPRVDGDPVGSPRCKPREGGPLVGTLSVLRWMRYAVEDLSRLPEPVHALRDHLTRAEARA